MTTANKITIIRILLVPLFIIQLLYYVRTENEWFRLSALITFAAASLSDALDGYLARRYNQRSELGAILDPLADKLLLVSGVVLLSLDNEPCLPRIPFYLAATIISRDVLLLIGLIVVHHFCHQVKVRPILLGKIATVLQMATLLWAMFKWPLPVLGWLAIGAAIATGVSGAVYFLDGVRQLSTSPSSAPSPKQ